MAAPSDRDRVEFADRVRVAAQRPSVKSFSFFFLFSSAHDNSCAGVACDLLKLTLWCNKSIREKNQRRATNELRRGEAPVPVDKTSFLEWNLCHDDASANDFNEPFRRVSHPRACRRHRNDLHRRRARRRLRVNLISNRTGEEADFLPTLSLARAHTHTRKHPPPRGWRHREMTADTAA
jgi:hypothetical protein